MNRHGFGIGETAQVRTDVECIPFLRRYLGEIVVVEGLPFICEGMLVYPVRCLADHKMFLATPRALRKLPPGPEPTDMLDSAQPLKVTRWAESPWKPAKVRA